MIVTFWTAWADVVIEILLDEVRLCTETEITQPISSHIVIKQATDASYVEWLAWFGAAVGCGLISKPAIERI